MLNCEQSATSKMLPPSPVIANGQHSSVPVTSIVMGSVSPARRQNGSKSPLSNGMGSSGNECRQGTPPGPGSPQGSSGVDSPRTSAFSSPHGTPPQIGTPPRGTPPMSPSLKFSLASLSLNSEGLSSKEILKAGIKRKRELQSMVEAISALPDMKEEDEETDEEIAKITGSGKIFIGFYIRICIIIDHDAGRLCILVWSSILGTSHYLWPGRGQGGFQ